MNRKSLKGILGRVKEQPPDHCLEDMASMLVIEISDLKPVAPRMRACCGGRALVI